MIVGGLIYRQTTTLPLEKWQFGLRSFPFYLSSLLPFIPYSFIMHPVQKHLFDTNFKDLAGSKIEGTIAISDELINMGIMDFLNGLKSGAENDAPSKPSPAPAAAPPALDTKAILALLEVETLKFRTSEGQAMLEVNASLVS